MTLNTNRTSIVKCTDKVTLSIFDIGDTSFVIPCFSCILFWFKLIHRSIIYESIIFRIDLVNSQTIERNTHHQFVCRHTTFHMCFHTFFNAALVSHFRTVKTWLMIRRNINIITHYVHKVNIVIQCLEIKLNMVCWRSYSQQYISTYSLTEFLHQCIEVFTFFLRGWCFPIHIETIKTIFLHSLYTTVNKSWTIAGFIRHMKEIISI